MEEVKETTAQQVSELLQIRRDKLTELQEAGRDPFRETRFERDATSAGIKDAFEDYENKQVSIAGRIMSKRGMGKAIFCHIQDREGQIQLYVRKDAVTETEFADFRKYDVGDIIGVSGYVLFARPSSADPGSSPASAATSTGRASLKSKRPCSYRTPAARPRVRS